ncbi:conserved hypothetical protein [Ricinus communis]|uniref:Uncharacterized protein n=1 Tax=Ricinus communis TaxID=3988 RepID=B9SH64_RICCO|nr:conserved hypothetical protein [Ricinus communis]
MVNMDSVEMDRICWALISNENSKLVVEWLTVIESVSNANKNLIEASLELVGRDWSVEGVHRLGAAPLSILDLLQRELFSLEFLEFESCAYYYGLASLFVESPSLWF